MKHEIRIAGSGGQGVVLAGTILGRSACIYEGLNVIQSQSYGAEARGGRCKSDITLSDGQIYDITVTRPDVLLIMNQASMDFYSDMVKHCPTVIVNKDVVRNIPETKGKIFKVSATKIASALNMPTVSNMVMLGGFAAVTKIVSIRSIEKSLKDVVNSDLVEVNIKALHGGYKSIE